MNYSDYQSKPSSEKITLAILSASKRLMGWALHSGSIYKVTGVSFAVIASLEDSGTAYTEVTSLGAVIASKFYLDRSAQTLYLRTTGSDNPNSRFLVVTFNLYLANMPVVLPHDLATGFDVPWEPLIKATSEFGVGIDTIAQTSEAIEGSGSLSINNDFDFWPENFDKLSFENQRCLLYSYHRDLDPDQAQLLYRGKVEQKSYSKDTITFQLKDQFAELRAPIGLVTIGSLGARSGDDQALYKQRMILGRVFGIVPTNIDRVLEGYPLTGTLSVNYNSLNVTGSGTLFLTEVSPDDQLILNGETYTVATVTSNTALTLTTEYLGNVNLVAQTISIVPDRPKRYMNRVFKVAGHALREPQTTIAAGSTIERLWVEDTTDIYAGDVVYVGNLGSGETVTIESVLTPNFLNLATTLATVPTIGTAVRRPAVQNVRIDSVRLTYERDYTFDATTAILTLTDTAEGNAAPVFQLNSSITLTNGSRVVSGTGLKNFLKPGYMLGVYGNAAYFEILSVDSDTQVTLRTAPAFTATATGRYKPLIFDESENVLTLDALGRTDNGTTLGALIKTAPSLTKLLIEDAGLGTSVDTLSFTDAEDIAYQHLGIIIPDQYSDATTPVYRDVINKLNKSVFGAIIQTRDFQLAYQVLRPNKTTSATLFNEADIITFSLNSTAEKVVKDCILKYQPREHDYRTNDASTQFVEKTSTSATYLIKTDRSRTFTTYLAEVGDATVMVARWSFLLSNASGRLNFTTKLQGASLEVGNIIEIENRKFFKRFGGSGKRKLLLVESVTRSGSAVKVEATDLSNAFNRVACINSFTSGYASASEDERLYGGYITDAYGLINNDPDTFSTNLIW